ncbi:MAG TPA: hypothetical protein VMM77_05210 [Gemmatimonadaceae bacterium]|nr:hypothetical protein [Gemmatimonadaceae bacterium]
MRRSNRFLPAWRLWLRDVHYATDSQRQEDIMTRSSLCKSRTSSLRLLLLYASTFAAVGCSADAFAPPECDGAIGVIFVDLQPPPSGTFLDYTVDVGDSIRVTGSLRRVDDSEAIFNPQQGWSCTTSASSQVGGTLIFSTLDTTLVRLSAGGWIRGLSQGTALVTASSTSPAASTDIAVLVYSP